MGEPNRWFLVLSNHYEDRIGHYGPDYYVARAASPAKAKAQAVAHWETHRAVECLGDPNPFVGLEVRPYPE